MSTSKPVVIPVRGGARAASRKGVTTPTAKGEYGGGYARRTRDATHQPGKVPPAVAALLAVTSIPPPAKSIPSRKGSNHGRERSHQETVMALLDEKLLDETIATSSASRSPLDILLSPADELEQDDAELGIIGTMRPSLSDEPMSLDSVPSLEMDDSSSADSFSDPSSPSSSSEGKKANIHRKEKPLSSPPAEPCLSDHPLLGGRNLLYDPHEHALEPKIPATASASNSHSSPARRRKTLKSNLTASLRVLRSAARSFSNFTATPAIQTDDFLTRSILSISPQFTDERRPFPSDDTPTPALRRYLNPLQPSKQHYQQQEQRQSFHHISLHNNRTEEKIPCTASIQLQTYQPSHRRKQEQQQQEDTSALPSRSINSLPRTKPPENPTNHNRPREPRENCDFLRVIVLEMNMRRQGKLSDTAPGRARFVLPPRKSSSISSTTVTGGGGVNTRVNIGVPERWIGIVLQ